MESNYQNQNDNDNSVDMLEMNSIDNSEDDLIDDYEGMPTCSTIISI